MAKKENITLSIDSELKAQTEALFKSQGTDISKAASIFYRQVLRYLCLLSLILMSQMKQPMLQ